MLSLGIGANAAIFSLLNASLLRPLPFPDAARLVALVDRTDQGTTSPTIPELLDIRAWNKTLDGLSFFDTRDFQIDGGSEPRGCSPRGSSRHSCRWSVRVRLSGGCSEARTGVPTAVRAANPSWS